MTNIEKRLQSSLWNDLKAENAPLRALVNGKLISVPEDYLFLARIGLLYICAVYQIIDAGFKQVGYFIQNLYRYI